MSCIFCGKGDLVKICINPLCQNFKKAEIPQGSNCELCGFNLKQVCTNPSCKVNK